MALIQKYGEQIVYKHCHAHYMQQWPSLFNCLLAGEPIYGIQTDNVKSILLPAALPEMINGTAVIT